MSEYNKLEYLNPYMLAWGMAEAANQAFDVAQQACPGTYKEATTLADFALLQTMAAPAMFTLDSPFARPGITQDEIYAQCHPAEAQQEVVLNAPIQKLVEEKGPDFGKKPILLRICNLLEQEGLVTLRDVLVVGSDEVNKVRNFGFGMFEILQGVIKVTDPNLQWKEHPEVTDVARLCQRLDQVTSRRIDTKRYLPNLTNVAEILEFRSFQLSAMIVENQGLVSRDENFVPACAANLILAEAQSFAENFKQARAELSKF